MVFRLTPRAAFGALVLLVCACGGGDPRARAAQDVHRFLTAVAADDEAAFETLIDRARVRADLARQVRAVGQALGVEVEGGPSDFALDRMISPATLRMVEAADGLGEPPEPAQLAERLKRLDDHSVCLPASSRPETCLLTFRRQGAGPFRLSGMNGAALGQTLVPAL